MTIDTLEGVQLGITTQWIRILRVAGLNPVLLLIQQGPGLPMINEIRRFEKLLGLEKDFTVVYWDQRGCGRSLRGQEPRATITLNLMVSDAVALLELLRDRFDTKPIVVGFSFGATVALSAAARRPDLVAWVVAVGPDIDGAAAGTCAYDSHLARPANGVTSGHVRQLEAIGPPPHLDAKRFGTRVRWASNFGGVTSNETYRSVVRRLLTSMMRSADYSAGDVLRTVRGIRRDPGIPATGAGRLGLVRDVRRLDISVVMVQGRLDQVAPGDAAQRYFTALEAPASDSSGSSTRRTRPSSRSPDGSGTS